MSGVEVHELSSRGGDQREVVILLILIEDEWMQMGDAGRRMVNRNLNK